MTRLSTSQLRSIPRQAGLPSTYYRVRAHHLK
jgi:hypothetical protein